MPFTEYYSSKQICYYLNFCVCFNTEMFSAWTQLHRVKQVYKGYIFIIFNETDTSRHHRIFNINKLADLELAVWPSKRWMKEFCFDNILYKLGYIPRNLRPNIYQKMTSFLFHNLLWKWSIAVLQCPGCPMQLTFGHCQVYVSLPGACWTPRLE